MDIGELNFLKQLGEGGFAKVYLAEDPKNRRYVIKKIPKNGDNHLVRLREVQSNARLSHPNIAKFFDHLEDGEFSYIIFERVEGLDFFEIMSRNEFAPIPEEASWFLFVQLLTAVKYMHKKRVYHRDIKLENLLFDRGNMRIKIIDLGLAAVDEEMLFDPVGSCDYASPEQIQNKGYKGEDSDIFSLGVVLHAFLTGSLPFDKEVRRDVLRGYREHPLFEFFSHVKISPLALELITAMLEIIPSKRIKTKGISNHLWVKNPKMDMKRGKKKFRGYLNNLDSALYY